ncbi:DUF3047 domain-containing protein [Shimia litoralis]|uniref:DUF3047 domain-containing protein n=1 Tax=Shimia litoralis TaxID=420403 RepID=A0A4U7MSZ6_9RHOB|nr:DUF3047 domain-containing protein [Shimia litoralis]
MTLSSRLSVAAFLCAVTLGSANAGPLLFDESWKEQGFFRFWSNDYLFLGHKLEVISDGTVSLVWRPLEPDLWNAKGARWTWEVREGVEGTNLRLRGGDDRNLAVYFVFTDPETANALTRNTARSLLRNQNTQALVYVWGGNQDSGSFLKSPYHPRLITRVLQPSKIGRHSEEVDLEADFRTAFGAEKGSLVGIGISADSDDTGGRILASIDNLELTAAK